MTVDGLYSILVYLVDAGVYAILLGSIYFLLRNTLDRNKGFCVELLTCIVPPLLALALLALLHFTVDVRYLISRIQPTVALTFTSIPIFVASRLVERLRQGDQLNIQDLFRLTTGCALAIVGLSAAKYDISVILEISATAVCFVLGEYALASKKQGRYLAILFSVSLVTLSVLSLKIFHQPNDFGWLLGEPSYYYFNTDRVILMLMRSTIFLATLLACSSAWRAILHHSGLMHRLGLQLALLEFRLRSPNSLIHIETPLKLWHLRRGVTYLNHGSFGAVPAIVRDGHHRLHRELEAEPMDVLARQFDPQWHKARFRLSSWLGTKEENIAFCENATSGMNEIAGWFPLKTGDEVILNDHEYGAVRRIWQRRCDRSGATLVNVELPNTTCTHKELTKPILDACNERTRLVIASHITSPTAIRLPVEHLCAELRKLGIASCIDGPHALLQEPLNLNRLNCDFYTASCHKWLCAPLGSGFVFVNPKWHDKIEPLRISWGRLEPSPREDWTHELLWSGSRDPTCYLSVPAAIEFHAKFESALVEQRNHALAKYARAKLLEIPETRPITPEGREWFGWMTGVWLPPGDHADLQNRLWKNYSIEVLIVRRGDDFLVRVSCHLYNTSHELVFLKKALLKELNRHSNC